MTGADRPPHLQTESEWRPLVDRVRAGRPLRPAQWPGGARCAVALSFDCDHEGNELGAGRQAVGRLAWGEFGRRVAVPRILDVLATSSVPASFFIPGICALIDPTEAPRIRDAGHEIGLHGWMHEDNSVLDAPTERELTLRSRDLLEQQLGSPPVGFRSPSWDLSPHTIAIVAELGLEYDSSMMADDSCYELLVNGTPSGVVEVPVDWVRDDAAYLMFNRSPAARAWLSPEDVFGIFVREFDAAWEEGGVFQLTLHPFVIGYRSRIWILQQLIEHAQHKGDVWFGTHADVARWVVAHAGDDDGSSHAPTETRR